MAHSTSNPLSLVQGLSYAAPTVATYFLLYPIQVILAGMYAKYFGLSLAEVGSVVFIARLFDAAIDPVIGYLSDRYKLKYGSRKPWIAVGSVLLVVSAYFLFVPPDKVTVAYFATWYVLFYLAWTLVDIPHLAWGSELVSSSHDKNRIYSLRATCIFFGALLFTTAPLLPIFSSSGFTPETLKWSVLACALMLIPILFVCLKWTPDGRHHVSHITDSPRLLLRSLVDNKPLCNFFFGLVLISLSYGANMGLLFIYGDAYLGVGAQLPLVFALSTATGLLASVLMYRFSLRLEKIKAYSYVVLLTTGAFYCLALVEPGPDAVIPLAILIGLIYAGNAIYNALAPSLLSDIADYGRWRFGVDRTGTYFAFYLFLMKSLNGLGISLGLAIAGYYGFDASTTEHTETGIFGLHLSLAYLPASIMFLSLFFVINSPINTHRHTLIQQCLQRRADKKSLNLNAQ